MQQSVKEAIMTNLTRIDPFKELSPPEVFRDLEGFFGWPTSLKRWIRDMPDEPAIRMDVREDEKAYYVSAEMPGVRKEDIVVEIDGNQVTLAAELKREKEEKEGGTVVHSERYYGKQTRSFTLGREIDRTKAEAYFKDGVLQLTLPKNGGMPSARVEVK